MYFIRNVIFAYKFKCDFTMCTDSADDRDTTVARDGLTLEVEKYDADRDVYERRRDATTPHEARPRQMRKVSNRGSGEAGIL